MIQRKLILAAGIGAGLVSTALALNGSIIPAAITAIGTIAAFYVYFNNPLVAPTLYDQVFMEAEARGMPAREASLLACSAQIQFGQEPCRNKEQLRHVFSMIFDK